MQRQRWKNLCHSQSDKESTKPDAPFTKLTNILDKGLQRGNIYSMDAVHDKYISLQRHAGIVNPSIQVRTLKQKLEIHYGSQVLFRKQRQLNQPQLLIPAKTTTEDVVALTLRDREENISPDDDDIDHESYFIQCLHTVATKLRADLSNTAGHQGYDLTLKQQNSVYQQVCTYLSNGSSMKSQLQLTHPMMMMNHMAKRNKAYTKRSWI